MTGVNAATADQRPKNLRWWRPRKAKRLSLKEAPGRPYARLEEMCNQLSGAARLKVPLP